MGVDAQTRCRSAYAAEIWGLLESLRAPCRHGCHAIGKTDIRNANSGRKKKAGCSEMSKVFDLKDNVLKPRKSAGEKGVLHF